MSDVTGPISTLPGTVRDPPHDSICDHHPARRATHRIQGETDSMGCEMHDLCDECTAELRESMRSPEARTGRCDWCKQDATDLRAKRDWEEGSTGPVYQVCGPCVKRHNEYEADSFDDDRDCEFEPDEYEEFDCHMDREGHCGAAGSEDCEFECPYRRDQYAQQREKARRAEELKRTKGGRQADMISSGKKP